MDCLSALGDAAASRDSDELREAVNAVNQDFATAPLLALLLAEDWHDSHEDIVFELGLIGNPTVVGAIAKAANTKFQSLVKWGNLPEFQRKCAFALARIGTDESRIALEEMAHSDDPYLRKVGEEGLSHWPMPYVAP
jgi:HEAT repeat protein